MSAPLNERSSKIARLLLLVVFVSSSTACTRVAEPDLVGRWRADYEGGFELLTLNEDRTYLQEINIHQREGSDRIIRNTGKWEYSTGRWPAVTVHDCLVALDDSDELRPDPTAPRGDCIWPVERDWGVSPTVRIGSIEGSPFYRSAAGRH